MFPNTIWMTSHIILHLQQPEMIVCLYSAAFNQLKQDGDHVNTSNIDSSTAILLMGTGRDHHAIR